MKLDYIIQEDLSNDSSSEWVLNSEEMTIFSQFVHNDQYDRIPLRLRQSLNKLHGEISLGLSRNWQGLQ
jgi:hypothetical protein